MSKNQINVGFNASENVKPPKNCVCINGLNVSTNKTQENIKLTNNQAEYFSELAEEYKNMAAEFMEQAKYYAENNADVTVAQFEALEDSLENYALKSELPTKVSELQNDSLYVKESEMEEALGELELLPSRDGCENMYLKTDGADVFWDKVSSGLEVGDVAFTQGAIDETKGLRRVLNGSVVTRNSNTQGLFDWFTASVAQNPDMATTESEWQSENTANGMCGKFVYTAESTTNYYAYTSGETTYFTTSTDDSESVNVYNSEFELQGTGSISSGVLTYNTQTYNRDSGNDDSVTNSATLRLPNYPKYFIGNIAATAPVVGNGIVLGMTDGTNYGGPAPNSSGGGYGLAVYTDAYGQNVGTSKGSERIENHLGFGVTTDPEKSGLEANIPAPYKIAGTYFIQIATGQETEVNITNEIELNNPYTLFDSKYTEAPLYNISWARGGRIYPKSVYTSAYEALVIENNPAIEAGMSITLPSGGSYVKRGLSVKSIGESITPAITATSGWSNVNNAFDNNMETYASCGTATDYIEVTYSQPVIVNGFTAYGQWISSIARSCNLAVFSVDEEGTETLLGNGTGADGSSTYITGATFTPVQVNRLRFKLIDGDVENRPPTTEYPTRILELYIQLTDEDITDYDFVINTTDEIFRLPLLDGSENLPGDKYDNISFPANESIYTAPANGWLNLGRYSTANNQYIQLNATGVDLTEKNMLFVDNNAPNTMVAASDLFLLRGQQVIVYYNAAGDIVASRFVYAKGIGSLYFYVGETVQNANLIDAGRLAEQISNCYQRTDSDNSLLAGLGMPSNNYVDLTLAASQEEYTAPFNGWLHLAKTATAANQYIAVFVYNKDSSEIVYKDNAHSTSSGYTPAIFIPIEKGAKFTIQYTTAGSTQYFRMIHLIGEGR